MVTFQLNILDGLGGSLDTDNLPAVVIAGKAGLDLMWIAKHFLPTVTIQPLIDAITTAENLYNGAKTLLVQTYDVTVSVPLLGAPVILKEGVAVIESTVRETPKALAFSTAMKAAG